MIDPVTISDVITVTQMLRNIVKRTNPGPRSCNCIIYRLTHVISDFFNFFAEFIERPKSSVISISNLVSTRIACKSHAFSLFTFSASPNQALVVTFCILIFKEQIRLRTVVIVLA